MVTSESSRGIVFKSFFVFFKDLLQQLSWDAPEQIKIDCCLASKIVWFRWNVNSEFVSSPRQQTNLTGVLHWRNMAFLDCFHNIRWESSFLSSKYFRLEYVLICLLITKRCFNLTEDVKGKLICETLDTNVLHFVCVYNNKGWGEEKLCHSEK